jgi:hypothetical protein
VAHDVFHLDDRIVHQDADHQRERQQRDHVDGKAQKMHADEGRDHRQRQRHRRHQRGAPVAQEQPHHQHGQDAAFVQQVHGAVVFLLHRLHEVEGLHQLHVGMLLLQFGQRGLHGRAHRHFAFAAAARDFKAHHGLAVQQRGRALLGGGVGHGGDLVQAYAPAVAQGQLDAAQFFGRLHRRQRAHGLFAAAQVGAPAGAFGLHLAQLARNVGRGGAQGLQARRVQRDAHFARDAAHAVDRAHAAHGQQLARVTSLSTNQDSASSSMRGERMVKASTGWPAMSILETTGIAHVGRQIAAHLGHRGAHVVHGFLHGFFKAEFGGEVTPPSCTLV